MHSTQDGTAEAPPSVKVILWLALLGVALLALSETRPPRVVEAAAPTEQFSAARAKIHLDKIAREPRPLGSAANHRARDYLVQQLESLGGEVRVERTVGVTRSGRQINAGTVHNIVARFPGTAHSRAVMLVAHYDSVPQGPGAADAGAGVIAILETVRALRTAPPLQNDLLVLFTDGEEEGLLGAAGFVEDHPELTAQVGVVLNFEARGTSGPAMMFETSTDSGWLVREFARAAPYPMAASLGYAVYEYLPNDTDMTVFRKAGLAGLNFAFTATFQNYHTRLDTPENLDLRSVQHFGDNAVALARHFGDLQLQDERQPDRVYFNWIGSRLIDYPPQGVWLLLVVSAVLFVAVIVIGRKKHLLTYKGIAGGVGGFLLLLFALGGGAYASWWITTSCLVDELLFGDTRSNKLLLLGCLGVGAALAVLVQGGLMGRVGRYNLAAGTSFAAGVVALAVSLWSPDASYAFQWPLVSGLAGFMVSLTSKNSSVASAAEFCAALPAVLILVPLNYFLFVALGFNAIFVVVVSVFATFFVAVTSPLLLHIGARSRWTAPAVLSCALLSLAAGVHLSRFSPDHPRRNSIVYVLNADLNEAQWISYDREPDAWTSQFVGEDRRRGSNPAFVLGQTRQVISAEAPLLPLEVPTATIVSDAMEAGQRRLTLRVGSPRAASVLLMRFAPEVNLRRLVINGRPYAIDTEPATQTPWDFRYHSAPPEGLEVELLLASTEPFTAWVGDRSVGLPAFPEKSYQPRPEDQMPTMSSDMVVIARQYTF
ncbi:MAG: M20/M25/M40 family metallo-hydrolase [Chthoniobacterales bacterium]|nr:M20/M25/M40 family metallo-hydrolase [Chthoniobacterales bacterium]